MPKKKNNDIEKEIKKVVKKKKRKVYFGQEVQNAVVEYNSSTNDDERNINTKSGAQALSIFVYMLIKENVDFLSERVRRIHLGAKAAMQDDHFHKDRYDNQSYTVLYYLNPTWKKSWGGHTIVGDEKIEYKPNRAIIYKSNISHRGIAPKGPSFRTYINYVVDGKK